MPQVTIGLVAMLILFLFGSPTAAGGDQRQPVVPPVDTSHAPDSLALDPRGRVPAATYAVDTATPPWTKQDYDGRASSVDDPDLTGLPTVHAIYVHPSDKASRFADFAAMFQADARAASTFVSDLYGRGVRFDERMGADKTYLDITVVRSKHSSGRLGGNQQFSLVDKELLDRGFNVAGKKYVVWLDARSSYCDQGHLSHDTTRAATNGNEGRTLGIVYRPYNAGGPTAASVGDERCCTSWATTSERCRRWRRTPSTERTATTTTTTSCATPRTRTTTLGRLSSTSATT